MEADAQKSAEKVARVEVLEAKIAFQTALLKLYDLERSDAQAAEIDAQKEEVEKLRAAYEALAQKHGENASPRKREREDTLFSPRKAFEKLAKSISTRKDHVPDSS